MNNKHLYEKDFRLERRLYQLDSELHQRFSDSIFVLQNLLDDYLNYFPEYTDHSETHSIAVIEYCNDLINEAILCKMNADELYILLMSCYLHDVGMGISEKDYYEFYPQIDYGDWLDSHESAEISDVIRAFHNDFSSCFVQKYADLFDIPSEKHAFAIMQTVRGHRKADLFDENEYPDQWILDNGSRICLPYLAAIIRLADEVNVAEDRNLKLMFDPEKASTEKQRMENAKHEAIKEMNIYPDRIELVVKTNNQIIYKAVQELADKLQGTLNYCIKVVDERTEYEITQKRVLLRDLSGS